MLLKIYKIVYQKEWLNQILNQFLIIKYETVLIKRKLNFLNQNFPLIKNQAKDQLRIKISANQKSQKKLFKLKIKKIYQKILTIKIITVLVIFVNNANGKIDQVF